MNNTRFDTTSCYSTTTRDREDVFDRHKEWLIDITWRKWDPVVNSVHKLHDLVFPNWLTIETTESRTADHRSVVTVEFVAREELAHVHFDKLKHFFVINHVTLVHEDD